MRRIQAQVEARLRTPDGRVIPVRLRDASALGLLLAAEEPLPVGTRCAVHFPAGEGQGEIEAAGVVVRAVADGFALAFEQLPYESYRRLREFLLRHAEDPEGLADELAERMGFLEEP